MGAARNLPGNVTLKEEQLIHAFLVIGDQSKAYIQVYKPAKSTSAKNIAAEVSKIFKRTQVRERLASLVRQSEVATVYDLTRAMEESELAYHMAIADRNPAAAVSAVRLRAQLNGLITTQLLVKKNPSEMTREELIQEIKGLGSELGIKMQIPKLVPGQRVP